MVAELVHLPAIEPGRALKELISSVKIGCYKTSFDKNFTATGETGCITESSFDLEIIIHHVFLNTAIKKGSWLKIKNINKELNERISLRCPGSNLL